MRVRRDWRRHRLCPLSQQLPKGPSKQSYHLPNNPFLLVHIERANSHGGCEGAESVPAAGCPRLSRPSRLARLPHGRNLCCDQVKTKPCSFPSSSTFLLQLLLPSMKCTFHIKGKRPVWLRLTPEGLFPLAGQRSAEGSEERAITAIPTPSAPR